MNAKRTSKKSRAGNNDADYCRFKGWEAGTIVRLLDHDYRITAVGEEAILVRRAQRSQEFAEVRWVRTLVTKDVVSATPAAFMLRSQRR
jgi:hypothetical protein